MIRRFAMRPTLFGALLACALGGLAWLATPPADPQTYIVLLAAGPPASTQQFVAGAQAAALRYQVDLGVEITKSGDVRGQNKLLARAEQIAPDAIIVCPMDPRGQSEGIKQLASRTHVVTCQRDAPRSERQLYVGRGEFAAGQICGRLIRKLFPHGSDVIVVWNDCRAEHQARLDGLRTALSRPSRLAPPGGEPLWPITAQVDDRNGDAACERRIEQALDNQPDATCLVCFGARDGELAANVLSRRGLPSVKIVAFEPTDATFDLLAMGRIEAAVTEDPYQTGYLAVARTAALCRCTPAELPIPGMGAAHIFPEVVTRDTLAAFRGRSASDATGIN